MIYGRLRPFAPARVGARRRDAQYPAFHGGAGADVALAVSRWSDGEKALCFSAVRNNAIGRVAEFFFANSGSGRTLERRTMELGRSARTMERSAALVDDPVARCARWSGAVAADRRRPMAGRAQRGTGSYPCDV